MTEAVGVPSTPDTELLDTGQALLAHLLRRGREILPTAEAFDASTDWLIEASLYINEAYLWACGLRPWRWARKRAQFVSIASDAVTVNSISSASPGVVTLSAVIAVTRAGRKFMRDSDGIPHRIATHTAGQATLTLETAYTGTLTSGAGTIYQDELTVASDILAFPQIKSLHRAGKIHVIPETELNDIAPVNRVGSSYGDRYAAFIDEDVIRLYPWTTTAELFECAYNYRPALLDFSGAAATDTPILPREARPLIAWRALEKLLRDKRQYDQADRIRDNEVAEKLRVLERADTTFQKPRSWVPRGMRISGR